MMIKTGLIIVDVQNDFLPPDGALAVPSGDEIIPPIQSLLDVTKWDWSDIIATQDYHPKNHISFASTHSAQPFTAKKVTDANGAEYDQMLWPDHCVQGTRGAEIDSGLRKSLEPWKGKCKIARKACHRCVEQYSGFDGYMTDSTEPAEPPVETAEVWKARPPAQGEMATFLKDQGVTKVVVTGLAADYCVKATSLAALNAGFETLVLVCATRGIEEKGTEDAWRAIEEASGRVLREENGWEAELREWIGR